MTSTEAVNWLRLELSMARNIERQEQAQKLLDYYNGVQLDYLDELLDAQFEKPETLKIQKRVENIVQWVADKISRVFDSPPALTSEDESVTKFLESLDPTLPLILKKAEVYKNITRICGVHSWWDDETKSVKHTLLPSSVLFAEQDERDPGRALTVVYTRQTLDNVGNPKIEYVHWDSDSCFVWSKDDPAPRSFDAESNPDMVNPYGRIPIAFYRDDAAAEMFFDEIDETLMNAQDTLNVTLTTLQHQLKMQGFSQPVLTGWDGKSPIHVDPSRPVLIPAAQAGETQGSFSFVSPDSHITEIQATVDKMKEAVANFYGIKTDAVRSGSSGYALKLMNSDIDRRRVDDLPLSEAFLRQIIENDRVIWNVHNPSQSYGKGEDESVYSKKYRINFVEPQYDEDPEKKQRMDKEDVAMGVKTPADRYRELNPDVEPQEAERIVGENMQKNASWLGERKRFGLADLIGGKTSNNG